MYAENYEWCLCENGAGNFGKSKLMSMMKEVMDNDDDVEQVNSVREIQ